MLSRPLSLGVAVVLTLSLASATRTEAKPPDLPLIYQNQCEPNGVAEPGFEAPSASAGSGVTVSGIKDFGFFILRTAAAGDCAEKPAPPQDAASNLFRTAALMIACGPFGSPPTLAEEKLPPLRINARFERMTDGGYKVYFGGALIEQPLHEGGEEASEPIDENSVRAGELYQDAECLMHEGKIHQACELYEQIRTIAPKSRYAVMAKERLEDLEDLRRIPSQSVAPKQTEHRAIGIGAISGRAIGAVTGGRSCATGGEEKSNVAGDSVRDRLRKQVSVDFELGTLKDFCKGLSTWHKIPVECDEQAMYEIGFDPSKEKFGLHGEDTAASLLQFVLKLRDPRLDYYVDGNKVIVTTKYVTKGPLVLAAYDVTELLTTYDVRWNRKTDTLEMAISNDAEGRLQEIVDMIEEGVEPYSWEHNGGIGHVEHHPQTNALVVCQHPRVQVQVRALLDALYQEQQLSKERCGKLVKHAREQTTRRVTLQKRQRCESRDCPGLALRRAQATHLIEQSFTALQAGNVSKAKKLAAKAMKLDQQAVLGHPLTYKMQIFEHLGEAKVLELAAEAQQSDLIVVSEGKTFGKAPGGGEASSVEAMKPAVIPTGWCFDLDVDKTTGQTRYRLQAQFGPLTIRANRDKQGRGKVIFSIGLRKE